MRLDKWLWAARFFKTRRLAVEAIDGGKVKLEGERAKPAKELRVGQTLSIRRGPYEQVVIVRGLSERRGPASEAALLYEETPESIVERERLHAEIKATAQPMGEARPTKRDRRQLDDFRRRQFES